MKTFCPVWLGLCLLLVVVSHASAQPHPAQDILFQNVRIFDGKSEELSAPMNVLVQGQTIAAIQAEAIEVNGALVIDGNGRVLMPGLIDAHTHIIFAALPQQTLLLGDIGFVHVASTKTAESLLLQGFTSIRDLGGPVNGLKQAIDIGLVPGPRIWPSGAFISQTGGHGDFRLPNELPARPGDYSYPERVGAAAIADSPDSVRLRVREQLALGASQIKLMAGGGVSSHYDPLDVTQYTVEELRAAVEAAENWGTYVTVHAYTPKAVQQAIEAGVKCIEHGQLLDEETARMMAERDIWWSLQPFVLDQESTFPEGSPNRLKQLEMSAGTEFAYRLAKQFGIKTAWGSDTLFDTKGAKNQGELLARLGRWYRPVEVLRMATSTNAELLALSGKRSPYQGKIGVVEVGALADLILVNGDPLTDLELIADPENNFAVIIKDGLVYKNH